MRILLLLLVIPTFALAWGPFEAIQIKKMKGMDWAWTMKTKNPAITLELDCQSFVHQFHKNMKGQRVMSILLEEPDCDEVQKKLHHCFPFPGKACVKGAYLPQVTCGSCR